VTLRSEPTETMEAPKVGSVIRAVLRDRKLMLKSRIRPLGEETTGVLDTSPFSTGKA